MAKVQGKIFLFWFKGYNYGYIPHGNEVSEDILCCGLSFLSQIRNLRFSGWGKKLSLPNADSGVRKGSVTIYVDFGT